MMFTYIQGLQKKYVPGTYADKLDIGNFGPEKSNFKFCFVHQKNMTVESQPS